MLVAVFLIILILLLALLVVLIKKRDYLYGGEYYTFVDRNKNLWHLAPSFDYFSRNQQKGLSKTKAEVNAEIDEVATLFKSENERVINGATYKRDTHTPKRISDANLDAEILRQVFNVTDGYAQNEAYSSFIYDYNSSLTTNNEPITKITAEGTTYLFKDDPPVEMTRMMIQQSRVESFVDFSYSGNVDVNKAYSNVHKATYEIAEHLKQLMQEHPNQSIIAYYKLRVADDGTVDTNFERIAYLENKECLAIGYFNKAQYKGKAKQTEIKVPATNDAFKMDEYLILQTDLGNISMQIEDSENLSSHKSNGVEFIIRSFRKMNEHSKLDMKFSDNIQQSIEHDFFNGVRSKYLYLTYNDILPYEHISDSNKQIYIKRMRKYDAKRIIDTCSYIQWCFIFLLQCGYEIEEYRNRTRFICNKLPESNSPFILAWKDFYQKYIR